MGKEVKKLLIEIAKVFKLETMTTAGRFNLGALIVLVVFVVLYTANDMICYTVSAVRDAYKTTILEQNVNDPYATVSVFKLLLPIIILVVLCFGFLYINERAKFKLDDKSK